LANRFKDYACIIIVQTASFQELEGADWSEAGVPCSDRGVFLAKMTSGEQQERASDLDSDSSFLSCFIPSRSSEAFGIYIDSSF
jgi:hypothetical protein